MALDTTVGGASADSYGTLAAFQAWVTAQGLTALNGDDDAQNADMRRAAVFLDQEYIFVGYKVTSTQARAWPRYVNVLDPDGFSIPSDSIPNPIILAQFEIAHVINQGNDLLAFTAGAAVKKEKKKLGPLEKEIEYDFSSSAEPRIRAVEGLLRGYVTSGQPGESFSIGRVSRG